MTWLITDGTGYIGAHVVRAMTGAGERAVVYDDLSTGVADQRAHRPHDRPGDRSPPAR